jgi:hypothetical protein
MKKTPKAKCSKLSLPNMKKFDRIMFTRCLVKAHTLKNLQQMGVSINPKK